MLGDRVNARVDARLDKNHYLIQIRGKTVSAESRLPLAIGEKLQLQVTRANHPVTMKILSPDSPTIQNNRQLTLEASRQQILKQDLPKQQPLTKLVQHLHSEFSSQASQVHELPKPALKIIEAFVRLTQSQQNLALPKQLQKAFAQSGLFFEARMAQQLNNNRSQIFTDIKSLLLQLKAQLNQTPVQTTNPRVIANLPLQTPARNPELMSGQSQQNIKPGTQEILPKASTRDIPPGFYTSSKKTVEQNQVQQKIISETRLNPVIELKQLVDASLSRIQVHQSHAVISDQHPQAVWATDLPQHDGEQYHSVHMEIHGESQNNPSLQQKNWVANLEFDLGEHGTMQVRLSLHGDEINTSIRADMQNTVHLIEQNLGHLKQRFNDIGLQSDEMQCLHGCKSEKRHYQAESLVDIQL